MVPPTRAALLLFSALIFLGTTVHADFPWDGFGHTSPCGCSKNKDRVCAYNHQTYDNECLARCYKAPIRCKGTCPCPKPQPPPVPLPCTQIGHPCTATSQCCDCPGGKQVKCWNRKCTCVPPNKKVTGKKSKGKNGKKGKGKNGKKSKGKNGKKGKGKNGKKSKGKNGKKSKGKNGKKGKSKKGKGGKGKHY